MINPKCKTCSKRFFARNYHIKIGWGKYCSRECHYADKSGHKKMCFICGKELYRTIASIKHSKSGKFFCSKSCQTKWRNQEFIGPKHSNWVDGSMAYRSVLKRHKVEAVCRLCDIKDKRVLAIHHIDENHYNNDVSNLTWLCHNCHYRVHHDSLDKQRLMEAVV